VPDSARVGDVDTGWSVMRVALVFERGASVGRSGPTLAQRVADYTRGHAAPGGQRLYDAPGVRAVLARAAIDDEVGKLLGLRNHWAAENGGMSGVEGAMAKMWAASSRSASTPPSWICWRRGGPHRPGPARRRR